MRTITSYDQLVNFPYQLGASTRLLCKELMDRGHKLSVVYEEAGDFREAYFMATKTGLRPIIFCSVRPGMLTEFNFSQAYFVTNDKAVAGSYLQAFNLPTPATIKYSEEVDLSKVLSDFKTVVVKPIDGSHGYGITTDITTLPKLKTAIQVAQEQSSRVLLQQQIAGDDYRLLFVGGVYFAALRRDRPTVTGDGKHTILNLINAKNAIPHDDFTPGGVSRISIVEVRRFLGDEVVEGKILAKGETIPVLDRNNLSLGGESTDVTEEVNKGLIAQIEPFVQALGLTMCGVDIISTDISADMSRGVSWILELNARPSLRPHMFPNNGQSRNAVAAVVDILEKNQKCSIIFGLTI